MIVRFAKCELKIDQIKKDDISEKKFMDHELVVIRLIKKWLANDSKFQFNTSGSTGLSKVIYIDRKTIEYSCNATLTKLDPNRTFRSSLLCLNPEMIGGAMVVFRALTRELDLTVIPPTSDPFNQIGDRFFDLVSVVPLQLSSASEKHIDQFHTILVGGANLHEQSIKTKARIFSTFGMTETVSHFALREMNNSSYDCIGDTTLLKRADNHLELIGTLTNNEPLLTNDLIEYISSTSFKWLGRSDFVINTGGVKINPEQVEQKLAVQLRTNYMVSSIPDERLGNKLVLLIEGTQEDITVDFSILDKYEKPKEMFFIEQFAYTPSNKIDRLKTRDLLEIPD